MIRVLLVDDHEVVRQGLRLLLETSADIEVVGEASDGAEALQAVAELTPDVVLMDIRMPRVDGIEATERLQTDHPATAVVILTTFNEDDLVLRGLRAGARGYLLKDTNHRQLESTIRAAAAGDALLQADLLARVLTPGVAPAAGDDAPDATASVRIGLTGRELEVLRLAADGLRTRDMATSLHVGERTIKAHLASIYLKLEVSSRAAAIARAHQLGLLR